jgi:tetratricopeptide (TPR) repeat protein
MKRIVCIIASIVWGISLVGAQNYKQEFDNVQEDFEQRLPDTQSKLKKYLEEFPYTPYEDEIKLMQGVLYTEKEKYKNAIKKLSEVKVKNLSRSHVPTYYFYLGYAYLQQEDYAKTLSCMLHVKNKQSAYHLQATYYIGYCYYNQKDYPRALAEFLAIEHLGGYNQLAPYYIVQIYYAQHEYEKVYQRAEELLNNYPDNPYNDEIHRMLGEMYYQDSVYNKAVDHLESYRSLRQAAKQELLRNDMYLLGVANYMTQKNQEAVNNLKLIKLEEDSISENTCLHLGHAYLRLNDIEKAKLAYATAIRYNINPKVREEAMYNYVQVTYLQNSALGESITAFQDFIREYPQSKYINKVYALMADLYLTSKNYQAALDALQTIPSPDEQITQTMQYLRYQIAVDAFIQGKMTSVIQWTSQVISHSPQASTYKTEA